MKRQSFYFLTDRSVRMEFHVREEGGITLESLYNPPREPDRITLDSADEIADAIEDRVKRHLEEHPAKLERIKMRHDERPLGFEHLGRFAVPLIPVDTGVE